MRGPKTSTRYSRASRQGKILSAGVVEGRNVWKNNYDSSLAILEKAKVIIGADRLWVAPSCSLIHSPVTLANEPELDAELKNWLAFAEEKLVEVVELEQLLNGSAASRHWQTIRPRRRHVAVALASTTRK